MTPCSPNRFANQLPEPRIALIGITGFAKVLLQSLLTSLKNEGGRLVAATVINRAEAEETCRMLEQRGCEIFADYRLMLERYAGRLDLCIVPTGIHLHAEMTCAALAVGANVLVEKPLAGTLEDAIKIVEASRKAARFVTVGFHIMYSPRTLEMKRFLLSGKIGTIRSVEAVGSWPRNATYYRRNSWAGCLWADGRAVFDSPINNAFAHSALLSLFFAGSDLERCAEVDACRGKLLRHFPIETFDTASLELISTNKLSIHWAFTHADSDRMDPLIIVEGTAGRFVWQWNSVASATALDGTEIQRWQTDNDEIDRQFMFSAILESTRTGCPPLCTAEFALTHTLAISKIHANLEIGDISPTDVANSQDGQWAMPKGLFLSMKTSGLPRKALVARFSKHARSEAKIKDRGEYKKSACGTPSANLTNYLGYSDSCKTAIR